MDDDIRGGLAARQYRDAFELLVERYKDKVFRLAFSVLHDSVQAEDSTQDVFVKIWKGLPGYHGGASLSTWIYTITRNTCLTELKKRSARATVSLHAPEFETMMERIPALRAPDHEPGTGMDVQAMLSKLPEKYRVVLTLFYLEQKSYEEVARMLGVPLGTVKTNLFRAKKEVLALATHGPRAEFHSPALEKTSSRRAAPVLSAAGGTSSSALSRST
jgi:RNA polymerase sigma-70 factor (ECF subfamily)